MSWRARAVAAFRLLRGDGVVFGVAVGHDSDGVPFVEPARGRLYIAGSCMNAAEGFGARQLPKRGRGWDGDVCRQCGLARARGGDDPCIARLPGVKHACCGHGDPGRAYVMFRDGRVLRHFTWVEGVPR